MAFMATIGSKSTNGVAALHSEIIKETIFKVGLTHTQDILSTSVEYAHEAAIKTFCV